MSVLVYDQHTVLAGTDDGDSNSDFTIRVVIPASALSAGVGGETQFRVTVLFGTGQPSNTASVTDIFGGRSAATGNNYSFQNPPTRITFSGGSSSINGSAASSQTSDWVTLPETFDNTKPFVVSFHCSASVQLNLSFDLDSGFTSPFKAGNDASTQTASGYTANSGLVFISKMEIQSVGASPWVANPDTNYSVVASASAKVAAVALAAAAGLVWVPRPIPVTPNTQPAGWYQPLGVAPPVAKAQPGYAFVPFNTPQVSPPVPRGWLSIASSPPPLVAPQPGYSFVPFNTRQTNTATIDKWQQPLSTPILAPAVQPGSTFVPFNTAQFIATPPWGWFQSLSTAPPITQPQPGAFFVPFNTIQIVVAPPWGWHQSLPATPQAIAAIQSQPIWEPSAFPAFSLAWQQPLAATPTRFAAQQGILSLPFYTPVPANTVVGMPWQQPLSTALPVAVVYQAQFFVPYNTTQVVGSTLLIQRTLTGVGL